MAFGLGVGWLVGWCLILEYLMAAADVAVGWSGYFVSLLGSVGLKIPAVFASPPFTVSGTGELGQTGALMNVPAIALLGLLTISLTRGLKLSVRINSMLVAVKLTVIGAFIILGGLSINPANWHPFLPPNTGTFGHFGWSGVLRGAAVIFYAYLEFDTVSTAARETRAARHSSVSSHCASHHGRHHVQIEAVGRGWAQKWTHVLTARSHHCCKGDIPMLTCLICGGDMQQDTDEITELLRESGCIGTTTDSSGREFQFEDGERLEVGGTCNACDDKEIRKFLTDRVRRSRKHSST